MRRVVWIVLAVLVIAVAGVSLFFNQIATGAVERGGTAALGVETRLAILRISPLSGGLALRGLSIANPPGFGEDRFLTLGSGSVELDLASLFEDPVRVRRIELDDIELSIERAGRKTNYGEILDHLGGSSGPAPADGDAAAGPATVIDEIVIRNVTAHLRLGIAGQSTRYDVTVPELRLRDPGRGGAMQMTAVVGEVTKAILKAVAEQSPGKAGDLARDLNARLGRLGVPKISGLEESGSKVGETLGEAGRKAEDAVKGLGGLFRREE